MELLTTSLRASIPPLGTTDDQRDPTVHAKFFRPAFAWYVIEASEVAPDGRMVPLADPAVGDDVVGRRGAGMAQADLRADDWHGETVGTEDAGRPGDIQFFGYVTARGHDRHDDELGYFWLSQLQQIAGFVPYVAVERDRYTFDPRPLSTVKARIGRGDD